MQRGSILFPASILFILSLEINSRLCSIRGKNALMKRDPDARTIKDANAAGDEKFHFNSPWDATY